MITETDLCQPLFFSNVKWQLRKIRFENSGEIQTSFKNRKKTAKENVKKLKVHYYFKTDQIYHAIFFDAKSSFFLDLFSRLVDFSLV